VRNVLALGASTGGPEALRWFLSQLPTDAPPVVVVQHMPELYTSAFAKRLDEGAAIRVREASDGDALEVGLALVAPGNRHMELERAAGGYRVRLTDGERVSRHKPSVDVLFRSVAATAGARAVGVLLTGMGDDGAQGLLELRRAGAATFAEDESTCVVFGMPKAAIALGAAQAVLPLDKIPAASLAEARR
jgi:two-component system chemotaxis response regulator CheB